MRTGKGLEQLGPKTISLFESAKKVRQNGYAIYSNFLVGAAIRVKDGSEFTACNVETYAYNNSLHAEMGAISQMLSAGYRELEEIVVVTESPKPSMPCGFCRQYLIEFSPKATVSAVKESTLEWRQSTVEELLPDCFEDWDESR